MEKNKSAVLLYAAVWSNQTQLVHLQISLMWISSHTQVYWRDMNM